MINNSLWILNYELFEHLPNIYLTPKFSARMRKDKKVTREGQKQAPHGE
jgi:hypothetical protein